MFDGLVVGSGPTYFTVKATNFAGMSEAATYQIDALGNAFSTENWSIGVTTDGTPLPSGSGFDGQGTHVSHGRQWPMPHRVESELALLFTGAE